MANGLEPTLEELLREKNVTQEALDRLLKLEEEIENKAGRSIECLLDNIPAAMSFNLEHGIPRIRYKDFTEAGAAEELLHAELCMTGIPKLKCHNPILKKISNRVAEALDNVLQHHIIYSKLEEWGYSPKASECDGIEKQLDELETIDSAQIKSDPVIYNLFAMMYVRGKMDCGSAEIERRLESIYDKPLLEATKSAGERIIKTIKGLKGRDPDICRETFEKCLKILKEDKNITIVNCLSSQAT